MSLRQKSALLSLRIDPQLKDLASKAAADDHRSLTSLIEKLLADYLRDHGYLPRPGDPPAAHKSER